MKINRLTITGKIVLSIAFVAFWALPVVTIAENIILGGTTLKVVSGTTLVSAESLTIKNAGTFDNAGYAILKKNLTNENIAASSVGTGTVELSGTTAQTLSGKSIFQNLTINNATGVTLAGETRVNGTLTLTSGLVTLGSNNFLLGSAAAIGGAPSASAMLVATGTGQVRKTFIGAGSSFSFPVGDNTTTAEYSPVTLAFTAGTFAGGNYAGLNLVNAIYPGSPGGSYIKRYWNVNSSGISSFTCNSTFQYTDADVVGTEASIYCVRIQPTAVDYFSLANVATNQLFANNITAFGTFTGYQSLTAKTLNLTCLLEALYNGGGTMRKAQNSSGDQWTGTTADKITIELHNSAAYSTLAFQLSGINLSTAGAASGTIPGILSGSYYVTIKNRNTIQTVSASPISFAGGTVSYNFTNAITKAYGSNMKLMAGGYYAFFSGDVNQDDVVDSGDMIPVENLTNAFATGYLPEDANGDGVVDSSDMILVENNSSLFVSAVTP